VFKSYIYDIFDHKVNATNSTQKSIAKSLLNNLLGRFGIDLEKYETSLLTDEEFESMLHVRNIKGVHTIGDKHLVSYSTGLNYNLINNLGMDLNEVLKSHKDSEIKAQSASSVVMSAAVTAYARIIITKHKLDILSRGGELYYSDTDSIVTNMELPDDIVSKTELGKFKLEYKIKEGIFISGKTYCLELEDGSLIKRAKGVKIS
jgi:DNA polymerase type B, organellar and viral